MYARASYTVQHEMFVAENTCNGCNMAMADLPDMYARGLRAADLPDMYARGLRAAGPRAEGIHIRQIRHGHVTTVMYHFVPIVITPVGKIF